jgi:hypothetical protein
VRARARARAICVIYMVCGSSVIFMSLHYSPYEFHLDIPMTVLSPRILCQAVEFATVLVISSGRLMSLWCHLYATTHLILSIFELCEYFLSFYIT